MTAADLVIIDVVDENAALREQLTQLEPFRAMAKIAIEQLAERDREIKYQRARIAALVDEARNRRWSVAA